MILSESRLDANEAATTRVGGRPFFTFLVAFTVMCSGITSASTASNAFADNLVAGFGLDSGDTGVTVLALGSMTLVAAVNFRGVGESVKANVVLTLVEAGAPSLPVADIYPFITMIAVANSALINMLMASRLLYGMANQNVLPRALGRVHPARRTPWSASSAPL